MQASTALRHGLQGFCSTDRLTASGDHEVSAARTAKEVRKLQVSGEVDLLALVPDVSPRPRDCVGESRGESMFDICLLIM